MNKYLLKYLVFTLLLFLFFINTKQYIKASSYTEFDNVIEKIKDLDKIATLYKKEYPKSQWTKDFSMLVFLRNERYNSEYWNFLAGKKEVEFEAYVKKNDKKGELASLKKISSLKVPGNYNIDFIHMIATINASNNVCGWAGDLVELISETINIENDYSKIYKKSQKNLGNNNSKFNIEDIYSDIDGLNLSRILQKSDEPINKCLKNYYYSTKNKERIKMFITNLSKDTKINKKNIRKVIYNTFKNDLYVQLLLSEYNIDIEEQSVYIKANCYVFADYLYSNYLEN